MVSTGATVFIFNSHSVISAPSKVVKKRLELTQTLEKAPSDTAVSGSYAKISEELLKRRIIFIGQAIDDTLSRTVVTQLLYLDSQSPEKDIYL
jgi:ATP-dependent protease ClpP protease subunit